MPDSGDSIRFTDILTTASAVANYLGEAEVTAPHVLAAVEILQGVRAMEDLGRPLSPLVRRSPPGQSAGVEPRVRALVQGWFSTLGSGGAALDSDEVRRFVAELERLTTAAD
jgi:hypothetical protein